MKRYIKCEIKRYQTTLLLEEGIDLYMRYKRTLYVIIYHIAIFLLPSIFYRPIRHLSPNPLFIPSFAFYPLIRLLSLHPLFFLPSAFYPPIRHLSSHPSFIPSSAFYPPICLLSLHPLFIHHPYPPNHPPSVSAIYPNPG